MKGITPIIGVILLLLIVVALAGTAYTFLFGQVSLYTGKTIQFVHGSQRGNTFILKNLGTDPLQPSDVDLVVNGQSTAILNPQTIPPGEAVSVQFCPQSFGNDLEVHVTTSANTVSFTTDIQPEDYGYRVFSTSSTIVGAAVNGLSDADAICQGLAGGLGGNWMAWLSDSTDNATNRLFHSADPYRLVNCTKVADSWTDLTDGTLDFQIISDETGQANPAPYDVWTGTDDDGTPVPGDANCGDWVVNLFYGAIGDIRIAGSGSWSYYNILACEFSLARLYCIEQP